MRPVSARADAGAPSSDRHDSKRLRGLEKPTVSTRGDSVSAVPTVEVVADPFWSAPTELALGSALVFGRGGKSAFRGRGEQPPEGSRSSGRSLCWRQGNRLPAVKALEVGRTHQRLILCWPKGRWVTP
jgi:hypothetical protein